MLYYVHVTLSTLAPGLRVTECFCKNKNPGFSY